jgi:GMP synthase (glutamine-hydrolysing)
MMSRKIVILKAGEPPRRVQEQHGSYEQAIINALDGEGTCTVIDPRTQPFALDPACAGIIITGSAASAYDEDEWISKSADFLRRAADCGTAIYGICFGHQLVAHAFGGRVEKCPRGWELGTASISLTDTGLADPLFAGLPQEFPAQESHGDVVVELPAGATLLAGNAHWPIQAFRLGEKVWGTQFHPEFSVGLIAGLAEVLSRSLPAEAFPSFAADAPINEQIRADLRETPQARSCLRNFVRVLTEP